MITATESGNTNEYSYDGDGHRVKRYVAGEDTETWPVYGVNGELLAEYDAGIMTRRRRRRNTVIAMALC